jgi:DNA-binding transcriptional ArsR family regulator
MFDRNKSSAIAEMLKCMAHPVKLDILWLLDQYSVLSVSQIQQLLECNCEQSMLSHHLIKMKDKGILTSEKEGKNILYSIENQKVKGLLPFLADMENEEIIA